MIQIVSQIGLTCLKVTKLQSEFLPKQFKTTLRREKGTALDGAKSRSGRLEESRTFRVTSAALLLHCALLNVIVKMNLLFLGSISVKA